MAAALALHLVVGPAEGAGATPASAPAKTVDSPLDRCTGPAGDPEPGSAAWLAREQLDLECSSQGSQDRAENPAYRDAFAELQSLWASDQGRSPHGAAGDPLRYPRLRWDGIRGHYRQVWIATADGGRLAAELFAPLGPCADGCPSRPAELPRQRPSYPVVLIEHGGGAAVKETHWQTAEVLAEAGYLVLSIDVPGWGGSQPPGSPRSEPLHLFSARSALDYLLSTPTRPTAQGDVNPWWRLADRQRVALLGASLGAVTTSFLGQVDHRVDTVIAYDGCEYVLDALGNAGPDPQSISPTGGGCRSRPAGVPASQLRTSRLTLSADYFKSSDVPRSGPPDPHHKDEYHRALVARGVDSMQVSVRASIHAEPAYAQPDDHHTRYGVAVHHYYTIAWLDYQLKGRDRHDIRLDACRRLTARVFDSFADRHEIGVGRYDPELAAAAGDVAAGNVPWTVGGLAVRDRLSFSFASGYSLGRGAVQTHDMRNDERRQPCNVLLKRHSTLPRHGG